MRSIRVKLALAMVAGFGFGESRSQGADSRWQSSAPTVLLAKAKVKEEDEDKEKPKEKKKGNKKSTAKRKQEMGKDTKQEQPKKPALREIVGVLAVGTGPDGETIVTVTSGKGRIYALDLPAEALPKARELAGKTVCAKGRVRKRNDQFLLDRIQSCRPVAAKEPVKNADPKPAGEPEPAEEE